MFQDKPKVNIDVSAGASLKAELKTEIPAESSGRLIDALTDIIRPFSERRGFKADLIRLQRERVAFEVARIARDRLAAEQRQPRPVLNRILVPLLEKASLSEEEDDVLISAWGEILASATFSENPNFPLFIDTRETQFIAPESHCKCCRSSGGDAL